MLALAGSLIHPARSSRRTDCAEINDSAEWMALDLLTASGGGVCMMRGEERRGEERRGEERRGEEREGEEERRGEERRGEEKGKEREGERIGDERERRGTETHTKIHYATGQRDRRSSCSSEGGDTCK
ncbi:hypothetical protein D4764_12G0010480 [Takifugu flavidus]|uniref:Uncharacterized protein n=1 Tax=Takifugu flavidus TaxID=433684 RepID=A0A5C6PG45_9TELE|nr:hypothetical protein D4764_12G0010480 [Takifugu flavidus]